MNYLRLSPPLLLTVCLGSLMLPAGAEAIDADDLGLEIITAETEHTACNVNEAIIAYQSQQAELAETKFRQCLPLPDYQSQSQFYLGLIFRDSKQLTISESWLRQAVTAEPDNLDYKLNLIVTLEWLGRLNDALALYETILVAHPDHIIARIGKARLLHWQGQSQDSIAIYRAILEDHPDELGAATGLGFALLGDLQLDESERVFNQVLAAQPDTPSALEGLRMLNDTFIHKLEFGLASSVGFH